MGKNVPVKRPGNPGQRTIERWVTINGNHVPIFEGETEEDVKNRLDDWNKQNSGHKDSYKDFGTDKEAMRNQFEADTSIKVNRSVADEVDEETLATVFDTVADINEKYDCHIKGIKLANMQAVNSSGDLVHSDGMMACIGRDGVMELNLDYFDNNWYGNDIYQDCVKDGFHPPAADGIQAIIAHEMGHAILHKKLMNLEMEGVRKRNETGDNRVNISHDTKVVDDWLANRIGMKTANDEITTKSGQHTASIMYGLIMKAQETVQNNKDIQKVWGGETTPKKPNMALLALVSDYKHKQGGISGYASKSYHEMVAEAFCDVYCNGSQASIMSKAVYNEFCKEMKK